MQSTDKKEVFERKREKSVTPSKVLRVGKHCEITSISTALFVAPYGAEIIVEPGVYREKLYINKPITIRCGDIRKCSAFASLDKCDTKIQWVEIQGIDGNSVFVNNSDVSPVHLIGLKISCESPIQSSFHSINAVCGTLVLQKCICVSSSGPVLVAQGRGSRVIVQSCVFHKGKQGGVLAVDFARLTMHQTHCCHNAATGLELRDGASAKLKHCHLYKNGRQGLMVWKRAGQLDAYECEIHSHPSESGVLVSEAKAILKRCKIYGNLLAGIVSQQKGNLKAIQCEVHENCEGILIQDTGRAKIEKCKSYSNLANGIFVGMDHVASAAIIECEAYDNMTKGIFIGNKKNVVTRDNLERNNLGRPPSFRPNTKKKMSFHPSKKHINTLKKNEKDIKATMKSIESTSFLDDYLKSDYEHVHHAVVDTLIEARDRCSYCKTKPSRGETFNRCSRCKNVSYCSKKCQKNDWEEHKGSCIDKSIKYPAFIDNNSSV